MSDCYEIRLTPPPLPARATACLYISMADPDFPVLSAGKPQRSIPLYACTLPNEFLSGECAIRLVVVPAAPDEPVETSDDDIPRLHIPDALDLALMEDG